LHGSILKKKAALIAIGFSFVILSLVSETRVIGKVSSDCEYHQFHEQPEKKPRKPRVLLGIFTRDGPFEPQYRKVFRNLFALHPWVCSLGRYKDLTTENPDNNVCELIYTFVLGSNPDGPTELVDGVMEDRHTNGSLPILADYDAHERGNGDLNMDDITMLNIEENMNDGKSQTWFYYASLVMEKYNIDYAGKTDTDSLWQLDKYFEWAHNSLPPAPHNKHILAGQFVDKLWWQGLIREKERYFTSKYGANLHLYAAGQMYIMSRDLAEGVGEVARTEDKHYLEGHEDHDVSAMAFMAAKFPIALRVIGLDQRFWRHPVKMTMGAKEWRKIWDEETRRLERLLKGDQDEEENASLLVNETSDMIVEFPGSNITRSRALSSPQ